MRLLGFNNCSALRWGCGRREAAIIGGERIIARTGMAGGIGFADVAHDLFDHCFADTRRWLIGHRLILGIGAVIAMPVVIGK